jgi:hypothetical protein
VAKQTSILLGKMLQRRELSTHKAARADLPQSHPDPEDGASCRSALNGWNMVGLGKVGMACVPSISKVLYKLE